ncbi:hypothetical protein ACWD01_32380 [Streptomyces sp. NPDC002835]
MITFVSVMARQVSVETFLRVVPEDVLELTRRLWSEEPSQDLTDTMKGSG